jgi:hypothetical protein
MTGHAHLVRCATRLLTQIRIASLGHDDERWLDPDLCEGLQHGEDERRADVARTKVNDSDDGFAHPDGESSEVGVMGQNDSSFLEGRPHHVDVVSSLQEASGRLQVVDALRAKLSDDAWVNVLVGEQRMFEALHAGIFSTQTDSLRKLPAA